MHPDIPNELLLHIFENLEDGPSLLAVILTCHRFHQLGVETLLRTVVWNTEDKAENAVAFLEDNPHLMRFPRSLAIHPEGGVAPWNSIWRRPITFINLNHLSLRHLTLSTGFYDFLVNAPRDLTHLAIDSCVVEEPPLWFSSSAHPPIPITHLSLGVDYASLEQVHSLFDLGLPHPTLAFIEELRLLQSLTTDLWVAVSQPPTALARLTSFTSTGVMVKVPFDVWRYLNQLLGRAENLVELEMSSCSAANTDGMRVVPPFVTARKMERFVGPAHLATSIVRAAPALVSLVIKQPAVEIQTRVEAVNFNCGRKAGLRRLVVGWGKQVLRVIFESWHSESQTVQVEGVQEGERRSLCGVPDAGI
ncbi:hypothetical protein FB45DRAFT_935621, partial [Roridomyces roridus]